MGDTPSYVQRCFLKISLDFQKSPYVGCYKSKIPLACAVTAWVDEVQGYVHVYMNWPQAPVI